MQRTLVLDLDGTLADTVDDLCIALNVVLRPRGLPEANRTEVIGYIGNGVAALLARAFAARGTAPDDGAVADFLDYYDGHTAVMSQAFPGVAETLRLMAARGWRFAVCTNKPEIAARALLSALDLLHWCAAVGGGDSFPVRKPNPAHLLQTVAAAGGTPERAIMAGDHANDVAAASGANIPCIFAVWGYGTPAMAEGAAATAQSFNELDALCERLLPGTASG